MIHTIDVGSTNIKYVGYGADGQTIARVMPFPAPCRDDLPFYEVSTGEIMTALRRLLGDCQPTDSILFSVQMHGYVLLDALGRPVTEYISWRDTRATLLSETERFDFMLPSEAGVHKKDNLPLASLRYMRRNEPKQYARAKTICTLGSFIAHELCGVNAAHITDCAPTGFYDCRSGIRRDILRDFDVPTVHMRVECIGKYRGAAVYAPVGDQQASVAGSGICADEYVLNIGTAAQVCAVSPEFVAGDFESRPYFDGQTLCTVTGLIGGGAYASLRQDADSAVDSLTKNYGDALQRLPKRKKLRAIGGACAHHRDILEKVLDNIGMEWTIYTEGSAAEGLLHLWRSA